MQVVINDGGRAAAGYSGTSGDCVARSIAIVTGLPYSVVYDRLAVGTGTQRKSKRSTPRGFTAAKGINVRRKWFKDYMRELGFVWTPTMGIGTGCKVHLADGELPMGRLVVAVSRHYTAVIDGVIFDTHDPQREASTVFTLSDGRVFTSKGRGGRCVYGIWKLEKQI
jgi:hypothetical protein